MAGLAQLREKTQHFTVLYVEDSPILQKKMALFLGKLFKKVYQANNGLEGVKSFQQDKPDIIISDIDMPEMNGHEMIKEIKKLDADASIIVYSAYADSENLLKSIHLGVVDFIPKPVDIDLFEQVLTKVIAQKEKVPKQTTKVVEKDIKKIEQDEHEEIMKQLDMIKKSQQAIEFVNHYKGVPIYDKGTINFIDYHTITVEVPYLQAQAIKHDGETVLISEVFTHTMEAKLEKFNSHNNTLILRDIQYLRNKTKRRKSIAVEPNQNFFCKLSFKNTPITSSVLLLSSDYINFQLELEEGMELVEGNELDLSLQLQLESQDYRTINFQLKGELYTIEKQDGPNMKVMVLLEMEKNVKETLEEYISDRRKELIIEFKRMRD